MARPRTAPDPYLLSKVATLYYLRQMTQQEIAERLHLSRPRVSRLLQEAQACGVVRITVAAPTGTHPQLEAELEAAFGLAEARVVEVEEGQAAAATRAQIGAAAAAYLARTVGPGERIGMAWGSTLDAMVRALTPLPTQDVRVVQTLGGIGPPDAASYAASVVRRVAGLLGASATLLPVPGVVPSAQVRDALRTDPHVRQALAELERLDRVFVGIGSLSTNPVMTDGGSLPPGTHDELAAAGAVGDMALRFFDARGAPVRSSLDDRTLGITLEQLRRAGRVVAVAGGPAKTEAIRAGLRTGVVKVLITDSATARALAAAG